MGWFSLIYLLVMLGIVAVIISENRNPLKALPWILVVLLVPVLGLVLYIFFGEDLRHAYFIHRKVYHRLTRAPYRYDSMLAERVPHPLSDSPLVQLIHHITGSQILPVDGVEIFTTGQAKYAQLLYDLEQAHHHIHMQYYIIADDELGEAIAEVLIKKAHQGVRVRLLYDDVGSWKTGKLFWQRLRAEGVEVYPFMKVAFPLFSSRANYRNHRKVVVIDKEIGYIGGMNMADRYVFEDGATPWRDTHFRIEGAGVAQLQSAFLVDWYLVSRRVLHLPDYFGITSSSSVKYPEAAIQVILGAPVGPWRTIEHVLISIISRAEHSICIETPYFLPTDPLLLSLVVAAQSGIDVQLILPQKGDMAPAQWAGFSYVQTLLEAGVKVFLYERGMLHAKILTVDSSVALVGSPNLDFRSLEHNFEIAATIYSPDVVAKLNKIFFEDLLYSAPLTLSGWQMRPKVQKAKESFFRLFSPLL